MPPVPHSPSILSPRTDDSLAPFRDQLLNEALLGVGIAAIPSLLISLARIPVIGWHWVMALQVLLVVGLWGLWLGRGRWAYKLRAGGLLAVMWLVGFTGMLHIGPGAVGQVFLVLFVFAAVLFCRLRTALVLAMANMLSLALLGYLASLGALDFNIDYKAYAEHPLTWLHSTWNLSSYGGILAFIGWRLARGLDEQKTEAVEASKRLAKIGANVPGVIYQLKMRADGHLSFPYVSEGARDMFRVDPEALREDAAPALARVHPDDIGQVRETIKASARDLTQIHEVTRFIHPDKGLLWMERHSVPERLANGDTLWHGFMLEVTKLKAAEQRLAATLENTPNVAVQWYDREGRVLYWNHASEQIFGWRSDEAMGQTLDRLFLSPEDAAEFLVEIEHAERTGESLGPIEQKARHRDGSPMVLLSTFFAVQGRRSNIYVCMDIDVTEQRRSEEALKRYQFIANTVTDMMTLVSREHRYEAVNDRWCDLMEKSRDGVIGRHLAEVWGDDVYRMAIESNLSRCIRDAEPQALHAAISLPGLGERECEVTYFPYVDESGAVSHVVVVTRDVTEKTLAERQIIQAKEAAEEASRAKSAFLASMSHELRTPLNAVIGFAQILDMDELAPAQKDAVDHIMNGGRHLLGLINEILDLARIEAGRMDLTMADVNLDTLIRDAIAMTRPMAEERQIFIGHSCETGLLVRADEIRARQVLLNLLSNAVKYNRPGGMATVSCRIIQDRVRITVIDTGPGIPVQRRADLFQPFQRLGAERTAVEGTGIGLVICKKLTEAMGGEIGFDSEIDAGSRFWFDLPVSGVAEEAEAGSQGSAPTSEAVPMLVRGRVIYVEDNLFNQTVMKHVFRQLPEVELRCHECAETALEEIRLSPPDLILMDINLPGMSGLDALEQLKADPATAAIPVIAVSAAAMPEERDAGLKAGFLAYLTKPFDVSMLLDQVRQLLGTAGPVQSGRQPLSRSELVTTDTDDKAMAAPAITGLR
jgi:PAS domain S-box-containing protein